MKHYNDNSNMVQAVKHNLTKQQRKAYAKARKQRQQARGKQWQC